MAFVSIKTTQNEFLVNYLRGTGRELSAAQAETLYGIKNIRARATELRQAGLVVRTRKNTTGRASYSISARDVTGSRAQIML